MTSNETPIVSDKRELLEESKFEALDQLLLCTSFDQKYWTQDHKLYNEVRIKYLDRYVESSFDSKEEKEVKDYLMTKNQENSWVQYFLGIDGFYNTDTEQGSDHLIRSIKLGNPYAMYIFAQDFEEKDDPELSKYNLILKAANIGYPKAVIMYVQNKLDELAQILIEIDEKTNEDTSNKFKTYLINPYVEKIENLEGFDEELAQLYNLLYTQFHDPKYYQKFLEHLRDADLSENRAIDEFSGVLDDLIDNHLDLSNKYTELEKKYAELKKIKEMDFNDIVSNGVGEFL